MHPNGSSTSTEAKYGIFLADHLKMVYADCDSKKARRVLNRGDEAECIRLPLCSAHEEEKIQLRCPAS